MSVNLVPEDTLRAALRPYRVDPQAFEAAVRERLTVLLRQREDDPLAELSPWLRGVAAIVPLPVLAGAKVAPAAARLAPASGVSKLLGYVAFPAISLFVLLGATILSVAKIRAIRAENGSGLLDERSTREAIGQWWGRHTWGAATIFAATLLLGFFGATWLLFLFYIVSFGLLIYVLSSLAKLGLGNRPVIGTCCMMGLVFLGQISVMTGIGEGEIHFLDQRLITVVFFGGALILMIGNIASAKRAGWRGGRMIRWISGGLFAGIVVAITMWLANQILWPATPPRIKNYVESFDAAPFSSSSWRQWEIVASWTIESKLDPNLSSARRLLDAELSGKQNPFVLSSAFRLGLVPSNRIEELRDYGKRLQLLLNRPPRTMKPQQISSLEQEDWVVRAAVLRNELTAADRDFLAERLNATLAAQSKNEYVALDTPLRATQLLAVIERPVEVDRYRPLIHDLLRKLHCLQGGGFQLAGGFKDYPSSRVPSMDATAWGVELMAIYGIPEGLDLNWVRSYSKPLSFRASNGKWVAAVTLDRVNRLPGATQPTWLAALYYERSLLAAMVLVGLCIYATLSSPNAAAIDAADESSRPAP